MDFFKAGLLFLLLTWSISDAAPQETVSSQNDVKVMSESLMGQLILLASIPAMEISREQIEHITGIPMDLDVDRPRSINELTPEKRIIRATSERPYSISLRKGTKFAGFTFAYTPDIETLPPPHLPGVCVPAAEFSVLLEKNGWLADKKIDQGKIPLTYVRDGDGKIELRFDQNSECLIYLWVSYGHL